MGRSETMRLSILSLARNDLKTVQLYLSEYGERPPEKFRADFEKFCTQVVDAPFAFSPYEHDPSYRRAVIIYDYLVFYKVDEEKERVKIYRVLHGKRNVQPLLD